MTETFHLDYNPKGRLFFDKKKYRTIFEEGRIDHRTIGLILSNI